MHSTDLFGNEAARPVKRLKEELKKVKPQQPVRVPRNWKLCLRPRGAISYFANHKHKTVLSARAKIHLKQKIDVGKLSSNARRKLLNAIKWLSLAAEVKEVYEKKHKRKVKWKINMLTFTFHENMQDDKLARALLSMWIDMAKLRFGLHSYVWKAEPQQRGAIHFHLIADVYIPHKELRYTWNRLLRKHGLNNINDNSTDVHAIINVENLIGYLAEYMCNDSKHEGRREIKGKLWGCSHGLSQAGKSYMLLDEQELKGFEQQWEDFNLYSIIKRSGKTPPEHLRFINVWYLPENYFSDLPDCELKSAYMAELSKLRPDKKKLPVLFPN